MTYSDQLHAFLVARRNAEHWRHLERCARLDLDWGRCKKPGILGVSLLGSLASIKKRLNEAKEAPGE